jgi:hypothetical protein
MNMCHPKILPVHGEVAAKPTEGGWALQPTSQKRHAPSTTSWSPSPQAGRI